MYANLVPAVSVPVTGDRSIIGVAEGEEPVLAVPVAVAIVVLDEVARITRGAVYADGVDLVNITLKSIIAILRVVEGTHGQEVGPAGLGRPGDARCKVVDLNVVVVLDQGDAVLAVEIENGIGKVRQRGFEDVLSAGGGLKGKPVIIAAKFNRALNGTSNVDRRGVDGAAAVIVGVFLQFKSVVPHFGEPVCLHGQIVCPAGLGRPGQLRSEVVLE